MGGYMRLRLASSILASVLLVGTGAAATPPTAGRGPSATGMVSVRAERPITRPAPSERLATGGDGALVRSGACPSGATCFKDASGAEWVGRPTPEDDDGRDRAGNEHAIAAIYRLAEPAFGTVAPEVRVAKIDGKPFLLSKRVVLGEPRSLNDAQLKQFADGFVIDAWLASWNVGGVWQLAVDAFGRPVRIDGSGGGLFRARGASKDTAFADQVPELETMRDPLHATSYAFRKLSDRDVKDQLRRFAAWYPSHKREVDALVDATTLRPDAASELKRKLATRAAWLIAKSKR